jgi:hypothetical protein
MYAAAGTAKGIVLALRAVAEATIYLPLHDQETFLLCAMFLDHRLNVQLGPPEYSGVYSKRSKGDPRPLVASPTHRHNTTPQRCSDHASPNPIVV